MTSAQTPPPNQICPATALFLDFDGCLVEIAERPDAVVVPQDLAGVLARLHENLGEAVALVSGRDVADLRRYLPDFPGIIAGSHGAEISVDGAEIQTISAAKGLDAAGLHARADALAAPHPAVLIERKPHGVAMHYRADPALRGFVEDAMAGLARDYPGLTLQPAKMALELRPAGASKDGAVARIMAMPAFADRIPVYAGDDATDEPALVYAQAHGGFGIKIGAGDTQARYRLGGPLMMGTWLTRILDGLSSGSTLKKG